MAVSCKGTKQALVDCLKMSPCMEKGSSFQECLKRPDGAEDIPNECFRLRYAFFLCKRGQLDMRNRFRGNRDIGKTYERTHAKCANLKPRSVVLHPLPDDLNKTHERVILHVLGFEPGEKRKLDGTGLIRQPLPSAAKVRGLARVYMAGRTRCIILPNKRDVSKDSGKLVPVPSSLEEFLKMSSEKLGVSARKAFTENGVIVDDVTLIRDDEKIFISSGEAFWKYDDAKVRTYKVAVLGAGGVGKSCLSLRYVKNSFVDVYDPTIEDAFRHQTVIDGQTCLLDILDTAGQEDRDGFLLVYSMTEKRSFDELDHFLSLIKSIKAGKQVPLVIVANKADLKDQRTVSEGEGRGLANQNGGEYIEASARVGDNISESFELLVRKWNSIDNVLPPKPTKTIKCALV